MDVFSEIGVFTRTVELGGFTRAAAKLGLSPSGVSRVISRLEERLGVRLLNRTTRSISLTNEGAAYFEHCTRILSELEAAEADLARSRVAPRGRLRVDLPIVLADFLVGPALPQFLAKFPEVSLDVSVRDALVDPTSEGVDVLVRIAPAADSELVSRRLGPARSVFVASPGYLSKQGRPRTLADLRKHACLAYLSASGPLPWRLKGNGAEDRFDVSSRLAVGSGNLLTKAALAGLGIAQTFDFHVAAELASGKLERILTELEPEPRVVRALFSRQKSNLPKVRVFLDFLAQLFDGVERPASSKKSR